MTPHLGRLSTERLLDYLARRLPGPGMVIVPAGAPVYGATAYPGLVRPSPAEYRADLDAVAPRAPSPEARARWQPARELLVRQAALVQGAGALLVGQIHHPGAERSWDSLQPASAPSALDGEWPVQHPQELTDAEIGELVGAYAANAAWIIEAGADGVEIHAAHGYLLNRFISPFYNRRAGRYGDGAAGRWRLLSEIVAAVREAIGPAPILGVRLPPFELVPGGLTTAALSTGVAEIAGPLDYANLSLGNHDGIAGGAPVVAYTTPWLETRPSLAEAAAELRESTGLPVLVTGGVDSAEAVEQLLASADLVGIARAAIADPEFAAKVLAGGDDINACIGCNECTLVPFSCPVNPAAGREAELRSIAAPRRRRVVIVGGGPAGLGAALAASARGHEVRLLERADQLGGVLAHLVRDPARARWAGWLERLERSARAAASVELGAHVDAATPDVLDADAVILATGGVTGGPPDHAPGDGSVEVMSSLDILDGRRPGKAGVILVAGGTEPHLDPMLTARLLASEGRSVILATELVALGPAVEQRTLNTVLRMLAVHGVEIRLSTRLTASEAGAAVLTQLLTGSTGALPVAGVVIAQPRRPLPAGEGLGASLRAARGEAPTLVVGDALAPRRLAHAALEGARFGNSV